MLMIICETNKEVIKEVTIIRPILFQFTLTLAYM